MEDGSVRRYGDAFGAALMRCWSAGAVSGVAFAMVERDDGLASATDAARYFDPPERWAEPERAAVDHVSGRVLDCGCGAGRHGVVLRCAGYEVVGVDPSPGAVAVAQERGLSAIRGRVHEIPDEVGVVDTVLLLGNNLGLLGSRTQAGQVLTELARIIQPGGRLLGTGTDPYVTDDPQHLVYHQRNRDRGRLPGQIRMRVCDGVVATPWFDYLFASLAEFRELIHDTPWELDWAHVVDGGYAIGLTRKT